MTLRDLGRALESALGLEGRLIALPADRPTVFVGDTHGDREASELVLDRFSPREHVLVFLGDYVDRGPDSLGNLTLLLETRLAYPESVHLLMGNHEGWAAALFTPADFWRSLPPEDAEALGALLLRLPLAAYHPAGILALHGALPDVGTLADLSHVEPGSPAWRAITWGDWLDGPGYALGAGHSGRPAFGRDHFSQVADRLGIRVLVRSHQPGAPLFLYNDRLLTLFTSRAYGDRVRRVAVLYPDVPIRTARDLVLVTL